METEDGEQVSSVRLPQISALIDLACNHLFPHVLRKLFPSSLGGQCSPPHHLLLSHHMTSLTLQKIKAPPFSPKVLPPHAVLPSLPSLWANLSPSSYIKLIPTLKLHGPSALAS